jgi:o-succinylbenzoate---CoA ligase
VPVPPGPDGPARLAPALAAALDGSGPAIAPIPTVTTSVSSDYVASMLAAARPDDPGLPLESDDIAVVLTTSGSTGRPRGVLLTAAQLTSMTAIVNGAGATPQWIAALPVTSMGGLNVLVRSMAVGREALALPSIGGASPFSPAAFHDAVDAASATSNDVRVALVPAQVSRLLSDEAGVRALRQCATVLVGGAAMRPSLRAIAQELGVALTSTYGATETAGGCVFDGIPLPGVTVSADGSPGQLSVFGPCVASGYRGDAETTRNRFLADGFRTPDIGMVADDGRVTVLGRADDIVVIRGVNVSPPAIERVIEDLPDVASAAVVTSDDDAGEPVVHAFVVTRETAPDIEGEILATVVRLLGAAAGPRRIHRVGQLPHLPNGKVDRRLLLAMIDTGEGTD